MSIREFVREIQFLAKQYDKSYTDLSGVEFEARKLYMRVYTKGFDDGKQSAAEKASDLASVILKLTATTEGLTEVT